MASDYRLSPTMAARVLGGVLVCIAAIILVATVSVAAFNLHTVFLVVPVALAVGVLLATWWIWRTRGWVVRLTDEGYRVQWVRGVGVPSGRWKDVEDAVTTDVSGAPVLVLRLREGRTTTIPVEMVSGDRELFARDVIAHLQRGQGLRPL